MIYKNLSLLLSSDKLSEDYGDNALKYIFFDLDGTLTDPGIGITNSVMHALRKMGKIGRAHGLNSSH